MLAQLKTLWNGLDPRRRLIVGLSALAIIAAVVGIARVATTPSMALLYSGLDAAAAGEVVAALEARGVAFEVREQAIYVDGAQRDSVRMALATEGLPASGPAGYELLDTLSGFGTTSQMFDAAYWRAKEGELARTIIGASNVRSARVHLANPVSQPFSRTPMGSASVTVSMARGALDAAQAEAIRYLVSSAVAGLAPEAVTVIDAARGVVLGGADNGDPAGVAASSDRAEALRLNVQRLLEARVGPGRAIVEVSVDTAMDSETISERVIDPASRVAISNDTEASEATSSGPAPGVTVASNLPDGDANAGGGNNSSTSSTTRERQNFEVSETLRERVVTPGQVRRISVAVLVDGLVAPGPDSQPEWRARSPEEIETLRSLVQTAVGFDPARGDTVTIESLQFTALPEQGSLAERSGRDWIADNAARFVQIGMLGAIVLALMLFVVRPMVSRRPAEPLPQLTGRPGPGSDGAALGVVEAAGATQGDIFVNGPPPAVSKIDRLREVIGNRTEESSQILRSWIEDPETNY